MGSRKAVGRRGSFWSTAAEIAFSTGMALDGEVSQCSRAARSCSRADEDAEGPSTPAMDVASSRCSQTQQVVTLVGHHAAARHNKLLH